LPDPRKELRGSSSKTITLAAVNICEEIPVARAADVSTFTIVKGTVNPRGYKTPAKEY
jgi:hypothetical protein